MSPATPDGIIFTTPFLKPLTRVVHHPEMVGEGGDQVAFHPIHARGLCASHDGGLPSVGHAAGANRQSGGAAEVPRCDTWPQGHQTWRGGGRLYQGSLTSEAAV